MEINCVEIATHTTMFLIEHIFSVALLLLNEISFNVIFCCLFANSNSIGLKNYMHDLDIKPVIIVPISINLVHLYCSSL